MSFPLPPASSHARSLIDLASIAEILAPENAGKLMPIWQARKVAEGMFAADKAIARVALVIVRADTDERWLVTFGPRGGWRKEWNFGTGRPTLAEIRATEYAAAKAGTNSALKAYWAGSATASVLRDCQAGRTVTLNPQED